MLGSAVRDIDATGPARGTSRTSAITSSARSQLLNNRVPDQVTQARRQADTLRGITTTSPKACRCGSPEAPHTAAVGPTSGFSPATTTPD